MGRWADPAEKKGRARGGGGAPASEGEKQRTAPEGARVKAEAGGEAGGGQAAAAEPEGEPCSEEQLRSEWPLGKRVEVASTAPHHPSPPLTTPHLSSPHHSSPALTTPDHTSPPLAAPHRPSPPPRR